MSLKRSALVLAFLSCTLSAAADTHKIDGAAAVSYVDQSTLFGFQFGFARTLGSGPHEHGQRRRFAIEADLGAHFLGDEDTEITALVGPRFTAWAGRDAEARETKSALFFHALAGVTHRVDLGEGHNDPALALGVGYDALLDKGRSTGVRFTFDWIVTSGEDYPRASIGIVYRVPYGH
jgi:hypothetical protein